MILPAELTNGNRISTLNDEIHLFFTKLFSNLFRIA